MSYNPQVFREYDIRGFVNRDLSEEFAYNLGRAYGSLAREGGRNNIGIGWDTRESSSGYANALAKGLTDEGINTVLLGMCPTPVLYYAIIKRNFGGGIQITGSHNPSNMNGFKVCVGTHTLSGNEIQELRIRFETISGKSPTVSARGVITEISLIDEYINELILNSKLHMGHKRLKIVVDAGNGVSGLTGPKILRAIGCDVVPLYCEPDGRFPNHHPDPTVPEYLRDLMAKVRSEKADLGIGWDGDGDRIGVVDEKGEIIFGDMLLILYARTILKEKPGAVIIGDVKCSTRLFDDLKHKGADIIMWKTGHSLIKRKLKEIGGDLGGEMSGHIFFKHRYYGFDDAVYASCRLAEILSNADVPASNLLSDLPKMVATPEIRIECADHLKFKIAEKAKTAFPEYKVITIDGVRIEFERGWGLARASNTQPVLVLRFEAQTIEELEEYKGIVTSRIEQIKKTLT